MLLSQHLTPAECFHTATNTATATRKRARPLAFRNDNQETDILNFSLSKKEQRLPAWLSRSQSHLAETNMALLQKAMIESTLFTENESLKLMLAIEEATAGDRNKVAGAAQFCLILTETMEMGLNALVAAAFHYASCVTARESKSEWALPVVNMESSYGQHAAAIVRDAGHLKRLEMVAAADAGPATRVRPDHQDAENLRKLLLSETQDWRALAIRSGACLYRLRGLGDQRSKEAARTAREALTIYAPLASRLGLHRLKNELEGAAFRILYPRQYARVNDFGDGDLKAKMNTVLHQIQQDVALMLQQDEEFVGLVEDFTVTARVKEPYSMWKKMLRDGYKHILQVPDALAMRVVLDAKKLTPDEPDEVTRARERALCYYAQRLCTERYTPVPSNPRFKDYIESPKANGYQSLHYTAETTLGDQAWTCEIQVRSGEMHQVAEFGLASHWDYKLQQTTVSIEQDGQQLDESSAAYMRNVLEYKQHGAAKWDATPASSEPVVRDDIWQNRQRADRIRERTARLEPYLQALTAAQMDLAAQHVFVFVDGQVTALPAGACVLDALRMANYHQRDAALELNGSAASVTQLLNNGDILTVQRAAVSL